MTDPAVWEQVEGALARLEPNDLSPKAQQEVERIMAGPRCTPVGGLEIADRLGVKRRTVAMWKQRGLLPPARWTVSGEDAWDWAEDIEPWAEQTGRLRS